MANQIAELDKLDQPFHWGLMLLIPIYTLVIFAVVIFLPAGDWQWVNGWLFSITISLNITVSYLIINQRNPRVLRNRMKVKKTGLSAATREAASSDRFVYPLMGIGFFGALIVPGIGHRLGWHALPFAIVVAGVVVMNLALIFVNVATLQNAYASKILDINQDQMLVDTGLYAHVRHPLYAGGIAMILATPIALGSLWGLIPASLAALVLIVRIKFEEEMLLQGLEGYQDYQARVRYKLIPKVY